MSEPSRHEVWLKRVNLCLQVAMGCYLFYLVLPDAAKEKVRDIILKPTLLERRARQRRADLRDMEARTMWDIIQLPEAIGHE